MEGGFGGTPNQKKPTSGSRPCAFANKREADFRRRFALLKV